MCCLMKLNKRNTSLKWYTSVSLVTPDEIQEMDIMEAFTLNQVWKVKKTFP